MLINYSTLFIKIANGFKFQQLFYFPESILIFFFVTLIIYYDALYFLWSYILLVKFKQ